MKRYITKRPKSDDDWYYDEPLLRDLVVYEPEPQPQPTGLLDKRGNELFSVNDMRSVGFLGKKRG